MENNILEIFIGGMGLLVAVIGGWIVIHTMRKRVIHPPAESMGFGFSLKQIDNLYQRGEITEEEYKALKRRKAERSARIAEKYLATPSRKPSNGPKK